MAGAVGDGVRAPVVFGEPNHGTFHIRAIPRVKH